MPAALWELLLLLSNIDSLYIDFSVEKAESMRTAVETEQSRDSKRSIQHIKKLTIADQRWQFMAKMFPELKELIFLKDTFQPYGHADKTSLDRNALSTWSTKLTLLRC
jgi:hypothetical protein